MLSTAKSATKSFKSHINNTNTFKRMLSSKSIINVSNNSSLLKALDEQSKWNFGFQVVANQEARIVERFGKYSKTLVPGLHFLIPIVDRVKYVHSLKEQMLLVDPQVAWTKDNIQVSISGNVFVQVQDAYKASYNVEQPYSMIFQMAYSLMRREAGLLDFDDLLNNRNDINTKITNEIKPRTIEWGINLLGYEIQNITPQAEVLEDLTRQSTAERKRREAVNESEGKRQVQINEAEGAKRAAELQSEGRKIAAINVAQGEAEAKLLMAAAQAKSISMVGEELANNPEAAKFEIAQKMVFAWGELAKNSPTMILSKNPNDVSNLVTEAFAAYDHISRKNKPKI